MQSMNQMQEKMLKQARWDGGWPRAVYMIPGLVALARNEEELQNLQRQNLSVMVFVAVFSVISAIAFVLIALFA